MKKMGLDNGSLNLEDALNLENFDNIIIKSNRWKRVCYSRNG